MKRFIVYILIILLMLPALSGCGQSGGPPADTAGDGAGDEADVKKISVVCTIFPQYDWVRQIIGDDADNVELALLLDSRVDMHSYQPSVDDIVKISICDLFIYVGGESDEWVSGALNEAANPDMAVIRLLDALGAAAKPEEIPDGPDDYDHGHDHGHDHEDVDDGYDGEIIYDEHVWLSLKNAKTLCGVIAEALASLDAANADKYNDNLLAYAEKLSALDEKYRAAVNAAPVKTLLFGDRFPFLYFTDDYGLGYHAAFPGCSAETEASFETIVFLAKKTDELNLKNVMVTESADQTIARTIINNTTGKNQQILVLDSMQSVTLAEARGGTTYLSVMESNLDILKEALK